MTTFSEKELSVLKEGGNEVTHTHTHTQCSLCVHYNCQELTMIESVHGNYILSMLTIEHNTCSNTVDRVHQYILHRDFSRQIYVRTCTHVLKSICS